MAGELQDFMELLATAQQAIAPPAGAKDIALATDEPPAQIMTFPCFVNIEREVRPSSIMGSSSLRHFVHIIEMHLLFAPADRKYAMRERRPWLEPIFDALDKDNALTGAYGCEILGATYDNWEYPPDSGVQYAAINFELAVSVEK